MGFELQFQRTFQPVFLTHMFAPPLVDVVYQRMSDLRGLLLPMGAAQPDEGGIGIAVNDCVALGFDQLPGAQHDVVAAQGDGRCQPSVEETAAAGPKHAVEGIHDDLQRLGQRRIVFAFGGFASLGHPGDDGRQAMPGS
ncbi:hypothetical protein D3C84_930580 [compost metagenome]